MEKEKSFFRSVLSFNCPRCRKGHLFSGKLGLTNALDMNKRCEHCDLNFEPEPGFYYGAMFLSYIFMGFFCLIFVGLGLLVFKLSVTVSFALLILVLAIGFLYNLRFARSLYIHLLTKYEPNKKSQVTQ